MLFRKFPLPSFAPSGSSADAADPDDEKLDVVDDAADTGEVEAPELVEDDEPVVEDEPAPKSLKDYGLPEDPEVLAREYAQYKQAAARAQQLEALYWQQQAAAQAAAQQKPVEPPAKPKLPWGEKPEFKREWLNGLEMNEAGQWVAKPGMPPDLPSKIEAYRNWTQQAQENFFADPVSALQDSFMPLVEQKAQEIAQRLYQQHEQQRALREYENQNKDLYFEADGRTLNQLGQHFNQVYAQAVQAGFADPIKVAHDSVDAALFRAQLQMEAQKPDLEKQKLAFQKKAANGVNRLPNRSGTQAKNGKRPVSVGGKDPWSKLRRELSELPEEDFLKDE